MFINKIKEASALWQSSRGNVTFNRYASIGKNHN